MALLNRIPDFLLAVVSCWLGLSLLVRAPGDRLARTFAWFCLHLTLYALTALLAQLTDSLAVAKAIDRLNIVETVLVPPAFLQFIMALTLPGQPSRLQRLLLGAFYAIAGLLAFYALLGPMDEVYTGTPAAPYRPWAVWGEMGLPAGPLNWIWIGQRVLPLLLALALMWRAYRVASVDVEERRQRRLFGLTAAVGVAGTLAVIVSRSLNWSPAIGRAIIMVAMVVLAYAVLAYRALLPARVAQRTFFYSLLGSAITTLYVGLLLLLEGAARRFLGISAPVVSAFMLVLLVAALGPLREWFRAQLDRRFYRREFDYGRLLKAIGDDLFERGDLPEQLRAALSAICRALGVQAGLVAVKETTTTPTNVGQGLDVPGAEASGGAGAEASGGAGAEASLYRRAGLMVHAVYGPPWPQAEVLRAMELPQTPESLDVGWSLPWARRGERNMSGAAPGYSLLLPLRKGDQGLGLLVLGPKRSGQAFSETERTLLASLSSYLASVISHAQSSRLQQFALERLAEHSLALAAQQAALAEQAAAAQLAQEAAAVSLPDDKSGLRVYALGTLHVERDGVALTRWGGDKAGTYQAEALFAFLFDRRGRGLTKDEAEEVIWPDLEQDIEKADMAFHRTLSALRRTLEPGLRRGNESRLVLYHHERYWLEPGCIAWADTDAFVAAAERGKTLLRQGAHEQALATLKSASELYRADYMDACRFFGDSAYVEERRSELRVQYAEVLLALGGAYEALGQVGEAAGAYRRAIQQSQGHGEARPAQARAEEGLARLQVAA
jgi:tetratricopeptide (TPR) repeat protein